MTSAIGELTLECDEQVGLLAVPKHQIRVQSILRTTESAFRGRVGGSILCHKLPRGSQLRL